MSLSHGFPVPMKSHSPVSFPSNLNLLPYVAPDAVKAQQRVLQQELQQQQMQQQGLQGQQLKAPGKTEGHFGSAASTTASSPSSSPPHSPSPSSPSVRLAAATTAAATSAAISGSSKTSDAAVAAPSYLYRLFAVVSHAGGSLSSGHYRAFVRAPAVASQLANQVSPGGEASSWLAIDDEMVSVVSEAAVLCRLQQEAYLLFYSKIPSKAELEHQHLLQQNKAHQQDKQAAAAAACAEEEEDEYYASSVGSLEADLSTSEDEWTDCSSSKSSDDCSSTSSSSSYRDSARDAPLAAALPFLHHLRKAQRKREVSLSHRRRVLLAFRCHFLLRGLHMARREALNLHWQQQQKGKQMQQQEHYQQQQKGKQKQQQEHYQQQPRMISVMAPEMMRERKKAAASRQQQFGCSTASPWEEEDEQKEPTTAEEQQLFERLQLLQQPLPNKRSRHDREYDIGRAKKVKNPHSSKPVGGEYRPFTEEGRMMNPSLCSPSCLSSCPYSRWFCLSPRLWIVDSWNATAATQ